jgi:hypothetical protein
MKIEFLKVFLNKIYDFFDFKGQKLLNKNINVYDLKKNKRCFIIATGTSLMEVDLSLLKNEFKLGLGFGFLHDQIDKDFYDGYVLLDKFLNNNKNINFPKELNAKNMDDQANKMYSYISKMNIPFLFINRDNYSFVKNLFPDMLNSAYFFKCNSSEQINITNTNLLKRFYTYPSTLITSIQIALKMGFKEIYLLGAGYTYVPRNLYHFYDGFIQKNSNDYENVLLKANEFLKERIKANPNKDLKLVRLFKNNSNYYSLFSRNVPDQDSHYQAHRQIKSLAKSMDSKIINIVPEGFKSKIYDSIKWSKLKSSL